jgi:hypothetical protein
MRALPCTTAAARKIVFGAYTHPLISIIKPNSIHTTNIHACGMYVESNLYKAGIEQQK